MTEYFPNPRMGRGPAGPQERLNRRPAGGTVRTKERECPLAAGIRSGE
jgi:hypothetical protein